MSRKPDDVERVAGLAGILQAGNRPKEKAASAAPPAVQREQAPPSPAPPPPGRKRVGKSSDPAFRNVGVYLRKDTVRRVRRRLDDIEADKDVSELVQELLEQWLASSG